MAASSRAHGPIAAAAIVASLLLSGGCRRKGDAEAAPAPPLAPAPTPPVPATPSPTPTARPAPTPRVVVDPAKLEAAIKEVEEPRGRRVRLNVLPELRQYDDRRRFLAIQMAESRQRDYPLPGDAAELAGLVLSGELIELPAMTDDYVLYQPGTETQEDPLSHYDVAADRSVRLLPSIAAWTEEKARLEGEARKGGRAGRQARADLPRMTEWYEDAARRELLFAEYADVTRLARDWAGETFDLTKPEDRARFQVHLLSCIRPPAAATIETLARAYHARFGRRLPVSSLTRTQRYQRQLRRVNRNATSVEFPPHTTGMAFDISYRFMPAEEQNFLVAEIARLKDAGRVEALRERRNSFHVFVFKSGRPSEDAVQAFMELMDDTRAHPKARPHRRGKTRRSRA